MNAFSFQLVLLCAIGCGALSLFAGAWFALVGVAALAFAFVSSRSFAKEEKRIARLQCGFAVLLIILLVASDALLSSISREYAGMALLALLFILALGILASRRFLSARVIEAEVLAYDNGYAVVRVEASMAHSFKGVHAISMRNARRGAKVRLRVKESLFSPPRLEHEGSTR